VATQALVKDAGPSGHAAGPVDVVPLLKSYSRALLLARSPPASLALSRKLTWLHMRLRPSWGSHYFTARYIRRRADALERALSRRMAVGEADENDAQELEALRAFKSSLPPPPSRIFTVVGLIAAILLSQALLGWLLRQIEVTEPGDERSIQQAFEGVSLSPDVKSLGDIGRALADANFVQNGVVLLTVFLVLYLFGRPLASGYRLSLMCLGQPDRLSRRRRDSDLWKASEALDIPRTQTALARAMHADLRRDAPFDLLVKSLPWLAAGYWAIGFLRFAFTSEETIAGLVLFALCATRLGWLVRRLRARTYRSWWIGLPLVFTCVIALILPDIDYSLGYSARTDLAREDARLVAGISDVPRQGRSDLQLLLQEHHNLAGVDLRGQDLHKLSLGGKRLVDAKLRLADIRRADLRGADLRGADLRGVIATGAHFEHADLRGATFRCSDLRGANFTDAKLGDAVVTRAVVSDRTRWPEGFRPHRTRGPGAVDDYGPGIAASYDYIWECFQGF